MVQLCYLQLLLVLKWRLIFPLPLVRRRIWWGSFPSILYPIHPVCQPHSSGSCHEGLELLHPPPTSRLPGLECAGKGNDAAFGIPFGIVILPAL